MLFWKTTLALLTSWHWYMPDYQFCYLFISCQYKHLDKTVHFCSLQTYPWMWEIHICTRRLETRVMITVKTVIPRVQLRQFPNQHMSKVCFLENASNCCTSELHLHCEITFLPNCLQLSTGSNQWCKKKMQSDLHFFYLSCANIINFIFLRFG